MTAPTVDTADWQRERRWLGYAGLLPFLICLAVILTGDAAWRAMAVPIEAGPFRVRLPEHPPPTRDDRVDLVIDPGATFGFGHESTTLALELIGSIGRLAGPVADVGCGSGILAIGAARQQHDAVQALALQLLESGQDELLVTPALTWFVCLCQMHDRFTAAEQTHRLFRLRISPQSTAAFGQLSTFRVRHAAVIRV